MFYLQWLVAILCFQISLNSKCDLVGSVMFGNSLLQNDVFFTKHVFFCALQAVHQYFGRSRRYRGLGARQGRETRSTRPPNLGQGEQGYCDWCLVFEGVV